MLLTKILVSIQLINYQRVSTHAISPSHTLAKRALLDNFQETTHTGEGSVIGEVASEHGKDEQLCSSANFETAQANESGLANESDLKTSDEHVSYESLKLFAESPQPEWFYKNIWNSFTDAEKDAHAHARYKSAFFIAIKELSALSTEKAEKEINEVLMKKLTEPEKKILFKYLKMSKDAI
ncbi:hypothetical protein PTTG_12023 [Puccinia triticina 1-1 BBBD Race 1]|uniref:Uncharacterized protein n=2 Tax=Puccinia triticina TaxID=208348 RepID=A0A180GT70_PUCT1|nr:uncharacterized protein PtA15_10A269 [Puccinia triticina]OAV95960.1 hypothetical protein PTTG_12023 [Puccinia triticina 1-1 BBBD Race 1]WAQ88848.1 hypothetical protein PtA15_10A269 [Puccinia triticina]WAR58907.1 hypothetical protein PtB15_10B247 [Puccinia triticina]